ncbi:Cupredoxin-like domain protein [uncultured archaeon]|nr:Cupredoxin-like domain protein [uncultured archaeon]
MKGFTLVLTVLLVLMIALGSCAQVNVLNQQGMVKLEGNQRIVGQDQSSSTNTVTIDDYSFPPSTLVVPKGTTVIWHNQGNVDHTVTSDTKDLFDSRVGPGREFSFSFSTPGTYNYHCSIHTSMHGTIVVTGSAVSAVASTALPKAIAGMPGTAPAGDKSSASWSEKPLSGETSGGAKLIQGTAPQGLSSMLNPNQSSSQSKVLQFSQYYKVTPQAPSKPLTSPTQYELKGQEPAMLYFGMSQKAVPYSQYQSYALYTGLNSLWIQGSSSWTQYAQVPQGSILSLLATTSSGGNGYLYETYPDGTLNNNGYYFYSYNQIGFYADTVGEHLLFFVIGGQPSNIIVIDVVPYQPPLPVYNYASITISSSWLRGYNVYVDGSYDATEGTTGEPAGVVTITVPGDQYHTVAVYGNGFSFTDSKFFNAGWAYTLNV